SAASSTIRSPMPRSRPSANERSSPVLRLNRPTTSTSACASEYHAFPISAHQGGVTLRTAWLIQTHSPETDGLIGGRRGEGFAVGRERHARDPARMLEGR